MERDTKENKSPLDEWREARSKFEELARKSDWCLDEHPLHALYLDNSTQLRWEGFKSGYSSGKAEKKDVREEGSIPKLSDMTLHDVFAGIVLYSLMNGNQMTSLNRVAELSSRIAAEMIDRRK